LSPVGLIGANVRGGDRRLEVLENNRSKQMTRFQGTWSLRSAVLPVASLAILSIASLQPVRAAVVAYDTFDATLNLNSYSQFPAPDAYSAGGDGFQVYELSGTYPFGIPFSLVDDTAGSLPTDAIGIVRSTKTDKWFGVTDTVNNDDFGPTFAEWKFDISGAADLSVSIDMAAMGDFEVPGSTGDYHDWTYSIDGSTPAPLFTSSVDTAASHTYTMENGSTQSVDDPLFMNGVMLDNIFRTQTASLAGAGTTLTIRLDSLTDGGTEAYAFDNVYVNGTVVPEPSSLAMAALAGLLGVVRARSRCRAEIAA
jgi:hypothetical protein